MTGIEGLVERYKSGEISLQEFRLERMQNRFITFNGYISQIINNITRDISYDEESCIKTLGVYALKKHPSEECIVKVAASCTYLVMNYSHKGQVFSQQGIADALSLEHIIPGTDIKTRKEAITALPIRQFSKKLIQDLEPEIFEKYSKIKDGNINNFFSHFFASQDYEKFINRVHNKLL